MSGMKGLAISFIGIAVLGGVAYWLERNKRQLSGAIDAAFGKDGYALPYLTPIKTADPAIAINTAYANPSKKV